MKENGTVVTRKYYFDNIRWIAIVLVFIHHICYMFNSEGLRGHFWAPGIPSMDLISHIVYPWFMGILFLVAGVSANYSLKKREPMGFRKERYRKLMRPFLWGMFLISPVVAYHMFQSQGKLAETYSQMGEIPMAAKYVSLWVMCFLIGMAQLWFILELYLFSRILLWIKQKKLNEKLEHFGDICSEKKHFIQFMIGFGVAYLFLCKTVDWICMGKYTVMGIFLVFRPQVYFLLFLVGYYIVSKEKFMDSLKKSAIWLGVIAIVLCIVQCIYSYGGTFTGKNRMYDYTVSVNFLLPALYAYVAILAIIGAASRWLNQNNRFTRYMTSRSFGFYILHYIVLMFTGDFVVNTLNLTGIAMYAVTFVIAAVVTVVLTELLRNIPVINRMFALGKKK